MKRAVRRYYGTPRNSTVRPVEERTSTARQVGRALLVILALPVVAWIGDGVHGWMTSTPAFRIERLDIEGLIHADADALEQATGLLGENAFKADLASARGRLLDTGWVRDAALRRRLPHGVHVRLDEAVPTALVERDGRLSLLDERACVIERDVSVGRFALPHLVGATGAEDLLRAVAVVSCLREFVPGYGELLKRVDVSQADRVTLLAEGHPPVLILDEGSLTQLVGYLQNAAELERKLGGLRYVDARWKDRLFLGLAGTTTSPERGA